MNIKITNSEILERVIEVVADPKRLSHIDLSEEGRRIRFNYDGIRYIVYNNGHVTVTDGSVEIGNTPEAAAMKELLDTPTYNHRYIPRQNRRR